MRIENIRNKVVWELLTILLVFAGLLFSYEVFSRDGVSQGSIVFDPMVITPTRTEMSSADLPYSIENIDLQSNLSQTIFRTVPEALRYEPGVMVQKTGHGQGSPYIRGFTGFRTLYLIDGIRLNNSVFRDGPNQYLNTVDPFSLSHLELVKGPSSVLYGSDAVGGTLNLISRGNLRSETGFNLNPGFFYRVSDAENSHSYHFESSGNYDDTLGFLVGVTYKDYGDLEAGSSVGLQPRTGYSDFDVNFKADYALSHDSVFTLAHQNVNIDDAWRTHKTIYGKPWLGTTVGSEKVRVLDQRRDLTYVKYEGKNFNHFFDNLSVSVSFQQQDEKRFRIKSDNKSESQGFYVDTFGFTVQAEKTTEFGRWVYGVEYYHDEVDSYKTKFNADGSFNSEEIQGPVADDASYDLFGFYIQNQYMPIDSLDVIFGGRFTYAEVDAQKLKDPITAKQIAFSDSWDDLTGSIRLLYRLDDGNHWKIFSGVSQGFRAPNLSDLTRLDSARSNEIETAALGLDPEQYISYEIGLKVNYEYLNVQLSYFYTDIEDMIIRRPTGNVIAGENEVTKVNSGNGYVKGIEFSSDLRLCDTVSAIFNVSWTEGYVDTFPTSSPIKSREPIDRLMPVTANLGIKWQSPDQRYWLEGLMTIAARQDKLSTRDKADTDRIPSEGTPGYTVYNIRGGWKINNFIDLTAALENIGDKEYRVHGSGVNEPGRNFILGVALKY